MNNQNINHRKDEILKKIYSVEFDNVNLKRLVKVLTPIISKMSESENEKYDICDGCFNELTRSMVDLKNLKVSLFKKFSELFLELEEYDKQLSQHLEKGNISFIEEDFADEDYDNFINKLLEKQQKSDTYKSYFTEKNEGEYKIEEIPLDSAFGKVKTLQDKIIALDLVKSHLNMELKNLEFRIWECGYACDDEELDNAFDELESQIFDCEDYMNDLMDETVELNIMIFQTKEKLNQLI